MILFLLKILFFSGFGDYLSHTLGAPGTLCHLRVHLVGCLSPDISFLTDYWPKAFLSFQLQGLSIEQMTTWQSLLSE